MVCDASTVFGKYLMPKAQNVLLFRKISGSVALCKDDTVTIIGD